MPTIQELHTLVTTNETKQSADDRIVGAEVRAVDNAIIDEIAIRGVKQAAATGDLAAIAAAETNNVAIPGNGLFVIIATVDAPDGITTFPSADAGWLWKKVADNSSANNGLIWNNGAVQFGQVVAQAGDPAKLLTPREVPLNGQFIRMRAPNQQGIMVINDTAGDNNTFLHLDQKKTIPSTSLLFNASATHQMQAGQTICPWQFNFSTAFNINGNVPVYLNENVNQNFRIRQEFWDPAGFPGGIVTLGPLLHQALVNLWCEQGVTSSWAGSTVGWMGNIVTRLKLSSSGVTAIDKYFHIHIGSNGTISGTSSIAEHYGLIVNAMKLSANVGKGWAIYQIGQDDLNAFGAKSIFHGITSGAVGTLTPTSQVDVAGDTGYKQLRMRVAYTPTGSADANGATGDVAWDDTNFYLKTAAGWKRSALAAF